MRRLRASILGAGMVLAALAAGALPAHAVAVSTGTGSGMAGQTVDIDINTASLNGLNVTSLQFALNYNNTVVTAVDVITPGSMTATAGWSAPAFYVSNSGSTGTIHVTDAGSTALTGAGSLLKVRFLVNPAQLNTSSSGLAFASFMFNEGTPPATTTGSTLTITATPQFGFNPALGEIIRGQTLQFTTTGSPVLPVAWSTSDGSIATISSAGLLMGVAPGTVTVSATDAGLHAATNTAQVAVRGMGITAGSTTVVVGQTATIPITVTSLAGLGIRSGQFTLTFNGNTLVATGITTPPGTLLNGWGSTTFDNSPGSATVDFAGPTDLTGSGVLCYMTFSTPNSGGSTMAFANATFNETLTALKTSGNVSVSALPVIYVNPDVQALLVGQSQQYSVSGSPTNPITWSVVDPTVASISSTGLVTSLKGGVTQVRAQDAVGAVDYSTSLTVYDFAASLTSTNGPPGGTVIVHVNSDRPVGALGIDAMQFVVSWNSAYITGARTTQTGLWNAWGTSGVVSRVNGASLIVASAGPTAMPNTGSMLGSLQFDISPTAPLGTVITLTLSNLVLNEGVPRAEILGTATLQVHTGAGVPVDGQAAFSLSPAEPNPARAGTRIAYSLPAAADGDHVRLAVYGLDGRLVRTLVDGAPGAGQHSAAWDGRDEAGQLVRAALYFTRLEWQGRVATRKLTLVH